MDCSHLNSCEDSKPLRDPNGILAHTLVMSTSDLPALRRISLFDMSAPRTSVNSSLSVVSSLEFPKSNPSSSSMLTPVIHAEMKSSKKSHKKHLHRSPAVHPKRVNEIKPMVSSTCKLEHPGLSHSRRSKFKKWRIRYLLDTFPGQ